ncbi:glucose oxidase [Aspergillus udagawae]|uniref:glucose oxidase n=1 Tax=Aspergillus udagawae TaxID=91492 RepID=A0ABQ1B7C8_9EURO|nr:glucose oxidase [Aspergillus udagawae]
MLARIHFFSLVFAASTTSYDYIIGQFRPQNPLVHNTSAYGTAFVSIIDYAYQSAPQTYVGNKVETMRAGKALGGTTTINGMSYTHAEEIQIDAWQWIGNQGWTWQNLVPYYKKGEIIQVPTPAQYSAGANYNSLYNGKSGPLLVGWTWDIQNSTVHAELRSTYEHLGILYLPDVNGG